MIALALVAALTCGASATQLDLDFCAQHDAIRAEAQERRIYRDEAARYGTSIVRSEALWRNARDTACAYASEMAAGGSMQPMLELQCRATSAGARARTLRAYGSHGSASAEAVHRADMELTRVYGRLEVLLTPRERALLASSQDAWNRYRPAACPRNPTCMLELVHARTQELKDSWLADPFW